jgi:hypothetical protein
VSAPGDLDERLRSTLADLRVVGAAEPAGRIRVVPDASGRFAIWSDDRLWDEDVDRDDVCDQMVHMLLRAALDEESSLVHVHAGAVTRGERLAVIAGWSASGKSTATAALVADGYAYVTDERLTITPRGRTVGGFPKPISLISGSFDVLAHLDPARTGHGASNGTTWQVPASSIGAVATQQFRQPSMIVFVRHRRGADCDVRELPAVTSAARLIGDSPDVIARGIDGAAAIVSLAARVPSYEIEYGDLDSFLSAFRELFDAAPTEEQVEPIELVGVLRSAGSPPDDAGSIDTSRRYALIEGVAAWVVDGAAVAYARASGSVVELDSTSAVWLQLLDDGCRLDELISDVAASGAADLAVVASKARNVVHGLWSAHLIAPVDDA